MRSTAPDHAHPSVPAHAEALEWLECFARTKGRPLRVLHLGNIANNAYNNAMIQRRFGIDADVLCHDNYHIMASPEWEDADFSGEIGDPFYPDWSAVDLDGFERPRWFAQGPIDTCVRYLMVRERTGAPGNALWRMLSAERRLVCATRRLAGALRSRAARDAALGESALEGPMASARESARRAAGWLLYRIDAACSRGLLWPRWRGRAHHAGMETSAPNGHSGAASRLAEIFDRQAATSILAEESLVPFAAGDRSSEMAAYLDGFWHPRLERLLAGYDLVQAYATYTAMPWLAGRRDYLAYEHGTIRSIPLENTLEGRLCAATYRAAAAVFVTNSDNLGAADRMGLPRDRVTCLPHAFDSDKLERYADAGSRPRSRAGLPQFFSPTRQHWVDADPGWAKGNDCVIRALGMVRDRGLACRLRLVDWGADAPATRLLIAELGLTDAVEWLPPMRKRELWARYLEADAVLDQFVVPAMGGVTFEAMMLGRRVITAIDPAQTGRFFGEPPPVFSCFSPENIAEAMTAVIADPRDDAGRGAANREWMRKYHSARHIVEIQAEIYRRVVEQAGGAAASLSGGNAAIPPQSSVSAGIP